MKSNSSNTINAILADAFSKTSVISGRIDMDQLMTNLCGKYIINGKEVVKDGQCTKTSADVGGNETGVVNNTKNVETL